MNKEDRGRGGLVVAFSDFGVASRDSHCMLGCILSSQMEAMLAN